MDRRAFLSSGAAIAVTLIPSDRSGGLRVSADVDDPGYMQFVSSRNRGIGYHVMLDGKRLTVDCITADEVRGEVVRLKRDVDNQLVVNGNRVERETLYGRVRLIEIECA